MQLLLVMMLTLHGGINMAGWDGLHVSAQVRTTSVIDPCSTRSGTAPHENYCDKYYSCVQNITTVVDCPNGLAYIGRGRASRGNQLFGPCEYDFNVDCSGRPKRSNYFRFLSNVEHFYFFSQMSKQYWQQLEL